MGRACALAFLLTFASPAAAQSKAGLWAGVGGLANVDSSWSPGGYFTTTALVVSAGTRLTDRLDLRAVIDLPSAIHDRRVVFEETEGGQQRIALDERRRSPGVSVLLGYGRRHPQWSGRALVGVAFLRHTSHTDAVLDIMNGSGDVIDHRTFSTESNFNWPGPAFGAEYEQRINAHIAVAADVRIVWFPIVENDRNSFVIRTGAGLRYHF